MLSTEWTSFARRTKSIQTVYCMNNTVTAVGAACKVVNIVSSSDCWFSSGNTAAEFVFEVCSCLLIVSG